jgi:hypothetical protein
MASRLVWGAALLLLCACARGALAMGSVVVVTRQTQARLGLTYTLVADRVDDAAVLVKMSIAREGKLAALRSVRLRIGPGRPIVAAPLQTTPRRDGSWEVSFQVSPALAEKSWVDLTVPTGGPAYTVYAVELKGYVTARQQREGRGGAGPDGPAPPLFASSATTTVQAQPA